MEEKQHHFKLAMIKEKYDVNDKLYYLSSEKSYFQAIETLVNDIMPGLVTDTLSKQNQAKDENLRGKTS